MKKFKYKAIIVDSKRTFIEEFDVPETEEPLNFINGIINHFNNTLRPGETPRRVKRIRTKTKNSEQIHIEHFWDKVSLVTERGGYDKMKCTTCGVTGKRYGLGQFGVRIDAKYSAKKYQNCDWFLNKDKK